MAFFQKPAIGLDLSDHSIEAVFIVRRGERLTVASYGRATLPPGAVVDGYVERRDAVSLAIRKLLADQMTPPLPKGVRRIVFALPESQVYSHMFEVPRVADDAELGRSLAVEADGYFPYPHQEMTADYAVVNQRPDRKDVYYAAVHTDTLKSYLALFAQAGLAPVAIESESASIARATLPSNEADPVLFVDIGARVTNIAVFDRSGIQFSEALETAGDAFTAALARALGISEEDADSLKRNHGVSNDLDLKAQTALEAEIGRLAKDVQEALKFYEGKSQRLITRILLCGGSSLMPGLVEEMTSLLAIPGRRLRIERADPWPGLTLDPLLEKLNLRDRGVLATTAVGLALRGIGIRKFTDIDFLSKPLPAAPAPPRSTVNGQLSTVVLSTVATKWPRWLKLAVAVAAVLALAIGAWFAAFRLREAKAPAAEVPGAGTPVADELAVEASFGEALGIDPPVVPVEKIETEVEMERAVTRASVEAPGYAKGRLDVVNESSAGQTLVATTRFLSEGGVLFRLDERVFVPAGGRVSATVTADQPGKEGDVPPGRFTIPGLSASAQRVIYGESKEPMRGGVTLSGPPMTEEDLASIRLKFAAEAPELLKKQAEAAAGEDLLLIPESLDAPEIILIGAPIVGQTIGSFTSRAKAKATVLAVRRDHLIELLEAALKAIRPVEAAGVHAIEIDRLTGIRGAEGALSGVRIEGRALAVP